MTTYLRQFVVLVSAIGLLSLAVITYLQSEISFALNIAVRSQQTVANSSAVTLEKSSNKQQRLQKKRHDHAVVTVPSEGNFSDRLVAFSSFLTSFRADELKRRGNERWKRPTSRQLDVVRGARDDYLKLLSKYSSVTTVALPWLTNSSDPSSSLMDTSNLLIQTYYEWTADDTLCSWIETSGKIKMKYDAVYNRTCNRNIKDALSPSTLKPLFLNGKPINPQYYWPNGGNSYPAHFYTDTPPYVFFMHIHRDAVVTQLGDVITDGLKLVLYACSHDVNPSLRSDLESIPQYNEMFVVSQYWGTAVFHRMSEIVPRIALFVDFLTANQEIRILAPETGGRLAEFLGIIGLDSSRLVTGVVRAKIVYQPRSTGCGFANVQESQISSQLYREHIIRTFPTQPRNRLILIRRSGLRRFTEQQKIEAAMQRAARDFNLTYTLFIDNPTPSLNDTMMMFHSAVVVVGPHGGGLSNICFSQPGTYVVEGVCNLPHVNLCYQRLAHILGHRWHGVTSRGGCEDVVDVPAAQVDEAVRKYLRLWSSQPRLT